MHNGKTLMIVTMSIQGAQTSAKAAHYSHIDLGNGMPSIKCPQIEI